jgi:hypothetical protein
VDSRAQRPAPASTLPGTRRLHDLNPAAFGSLREYFDEFWSQALAAFKANVEAPQPGRDR